MLKVLHAVRYTGTLWEILKSIFPDGFGVKTLAECEEVIEEIGKNDFSIHKLINLVHETSR